MRNIRPHVHRREPVKYEDLDDGLQAMLANLENRADDRRRESFFVVPVCLVVAFWFVIELVKAALAS